MLLVDGVQIERNNMKKNVMKKWVKALRSGKYKKTEGALKEKVKGKFGHCCLGVLCELYNIDQKKNKKKTIKEQELDTGCVSFNHEVAELPEVVKNWAGLSNHYGGFVNNAEVINKSGQLPFYSLSELNDFGSSFKVIAAIIEDQWDNL